MLDEWPPNLRAAWQAAMTREHGPFRPKGTRPRSPATFVIWSGAVGAFVRHLREAPGNPPPELIPDMINAEILNGYFAAMADRQLSDYTIVNRFVSLAGALGFMFPGRDFSFISAPDGRPIQSSLGMRHRTLFVPDARHLVLWAEEVFRQALDTDGSDRRRVGVRDAAILGIFAARAPRARTMTKLRIGDHLVRQGNDWMLLLDNSIMKTRGRELDLPLGRRVSAIVDRYVQVERAELLRGQQHDAVWIGIGGIPLAWGAVVGMVRVRSKAKFGTAFGPHRFRTSLTTTRAILGGEHVLDAPLLLGHSVEVSLKHYNRSTALSASRAHHDRIDELEDE